jgi:methylenetetrahydrofolate dehydrogenase (NADP+)/methenyltetrahydrofolate cyclohydrolase
MPPTFDGPKWRQDAINTLQALLPKDPPPVWVILFTARSNARFEVARVSAEEKVKAFKAAGVQAELVTDKNWQIYASSKQALLSSSTLKIVQQPLPRVISNLPITNDFDMNTTNGRCWPAVCEAVDIALSVLGGRRSRKPIAVVGAKGFIGKHLVSMLRADDCKVIPLDKGDSLASLAEAEFIISAVSTVGCLTARHINKTHIVLDLGFEKTGNGTWRGNLTAGAFKKARYATPVPGGMGPAQMAVLIERYLKVI